MQDDQVGLTQCKVCFKPTAGHYKFYGARVCHSCRAFFRRSVQGNNSDSFVCDAIGCCSIDSKSWKSCKKCRFEKCLAIGMQTAWVLTVPERKIRNSIREEGRKLRRWRRRQEPAIGINLVLPFSAEESSFLRDILQRGFYRLFKNSVDYCYAHPDMFDESNHVFLCGKTFSYQAIKILQDELTSVPRGYFSGFYDSILEEVDPDDRIVLLTRNLPLVVDFFWASHFDCRAETSRTLQSMKSVISENGNFGIMLKKMEDLELREADQEQVRALSYEQMYHSPWASSKQEEDRHRALILKSGRCSKGDANDVSQINDVKMVLMLLIILLSPDDGVQLQSRGSVECIRTKYSYMLHRYLNHQSTSTRANGTDQYCQGLYVRSLIQEAYKIKCKRLPV